MVQWLWWWERLPHFPGFPPRPVQTPRCKPVRRCSADFRLRDDGAALRMADEQNMSLLLCDHLSSSLSIIKQGGEWILDCAYGFLPHIG